MAHIFQGVTNNTLDRIMGLNFDESTNGDMKRLGDCLNGGQLRMLRDAIIFLLKKVAEMDESMKPIYCTMDAYDYKKDPEAAIVKALDINKKDISLGLIFYAIRGIHAACAYDLFPDYEEVIAQSKTSQEPGRLTKAARC